MDESLFGKLLLETKRRIDEIANIKTYRDLFWRIPKRPKDFFVGIRGLRGVGKTTLLLQLMQNKKNSLYFSCDAFYLRNETIYDIIKFASKRGIKNFFVDEIHTQKDWAKQLKTLYDEGIRNLFFSGSSAIGLQKSADLSRRAVIFELKPASFREYLCIKHNISLPKLDFKSLINKKKELAVRYATLQDYVEEYLQYGGVLYEKQEFELKFKNALEKIVCVDLAYLHELDINIESLAFALMNAIATTSSFECNYSALALALNTNKKVVKRLLADLEKAGVLRNVMPCQKGLAAVRKEPKVLFRIPFTYFLCRSRVFLPNKGRLREEFFAMHAEKICYLKTKRGEKTADYSWHKKVFEIGGVSKTRAQKADYILVDGIVIEKNKIPLFLVGLVEED